ncbi:MAG: hypothetical protein JWQ14_1976 [Adhaeribacter sp.]|nr:hypothetical protein [Adhaeribacter sp.]
MKNILVPTDFSDNATNALDYAVQLARVFKGRLLLFHNINYPLNYADSNIFTPTDLGLGVTTAYPGGYFPNQELERIHQENLAQAANQIRQKTHQGFPVETLFKYGSLTDNLHEIVRDNQIDLVVMGTRGASTFLERLMGTNTADVITKSPIPVLAVPPDAAFTPPTRIAFAADLEIETDIFINQLLGFAEPFGAEITLVHINKTAVKPDQTKEAQTRAKFLAKYPSQRLQLIERTGKTVAKGIENFIQDYGANLLAVGIHEHSFFHSVFYSSVPEQMVFHNTIPVLALPEKPAKRS